MSEELGALDTLIQEKLEADTEFVESLESMEEADKEAAIQSRRKELANLAFAELQEKSKKDEELANNYKVRAEKAEKGKKATETKPKESQDSDITTRDMYVLIKADVPEEDFDEVVRISKVLGKSIPETLKDPVCIGVLQRNTEYRATAKALNAGKAKAGQKEVSSSEILSNASKGVVPAKGSKEAEELYWARRGGRR